MLGDFGFLDLLSKRGTVAGSVTTCAADFLCAFGHCERFGGAVELSVVIWGFLIPNRIVTAIYLQPCPNDL